jgi:hypothetical protein
MRAVSPLLALILAATAVACSSSGEQSGTGSAPVESGVALVPMPGAGLERCRNAESLRPACPSLIPSAQWRDRAEWGTERGRILFGGGAYELAAGAEHPGHPEQDRPPRLVHLVVLGGREAGNLAFEWPPPGHAVTLEDGLFARQRHRALFFGERNWGRRLGELALAPPYPRGGIAGNHLVFRWREEGSYYAVTLHGWEPFLETAPALRALVASLPG